MNRFDVERAGALLRNAEERPGVLDRPSLVKVHDEELALDSRQRADRVGEGGAEIGTRLRGDALHGGREGRGGDDHLESRRPHLR